MPVTWILEPEVFSASFATFSDAVLHAGHQVVRFCDEWWTEGSWPRLSGRPAIFRGSLGNAAQVRRQLPWRPGAYCDVDAFHCSRWYPAAHEWLLHRQWHILPARELVASPETIGAAIGEGDKVFVRPDVWVLRKRCRGGGLFGGAAGVGIIEQPAVGGVLSCGHVASWKLHRASR